MFITWILNQILSGCNSLISLALAIIYLSLEHLMDLKLFSFMPTLNSVDFKHAFFDCRLFNSFWTIGTILTM